MTTGHALSGHKVNESGDWIASVRAIRQQAIAECIAKVEALTVRHWPYDEINDTYAECVTVDDVLAALREVQP